jgi:hypothetical protein
MEYQLTTSVDKEISGQCANILQTFVLLNLRKKHNFVIFLITPKPHEIFLNSFLHLYCVYFNQFF